MNPQIRWLVEQSARKLKRFFIIALVFNFVYYGYIQIFKRGYFQERAQNQAIKLRLIHAPRGILYDRNGVRLVDNVNAYELVIHRDDLPFDPQLLSAFASAFNLEEEPFLKAVQSYRDEESGIVPLTIQKNLTEAELALSEQLKARFPFLSIESSPRRSYRDNELAGHVLGYIGEVDSRTLKKKPGTFQLGQWVGREGIEAQWDSDLRGRDGAKRIMVNRSGDEIALLDEEVPQVGRSLVLTLDLGMQKILQESFIGKKGAAIVLDTRDGGVLAMYSSPSINPNVFAGRMSQSQVDATFNNPDKPMMNRAIQGLYPPGSTFKLLTALAGLEKKVITPETIFYCNGRKKFYGRDFRCDKETGHGAISLIPAIAQSCDIYFYEIANRLDVDDIYEIAHRWGLTVDTGIDLPNEKTSRIPSRAWKAKASPQDPKWYAGETISVGIGQGQVGVTPIGLAKFYATLANQGRPVRPHLYYGDKSESTGQVNIKDVPSLPFITLEPRYWAIIHEGLLQTVRSGTAAGSRLNDVDMLGKTGTAQVAKFVNRSHYLQQAKSLRDHAWFAGYASKDRPEIAFAVLVENGGFGADTAAPIAAKLVKYWMVDRPRLDPSANSSSSPSRR